MFKLNVDNPSIEPMASGHIIEQIEMIKKIINNGFGYEVNGSVYFDVFKYNDTIIYRINIFVNSTITTSTIKELIRK